MHVEKGFASHVNSGNHSDVACGIHVAMHVTRPLPVPRGKNGTKPKSE